jgi:hypothetical protein
MFDLKVPFFRPLWIRVITVLICFAWGAFEFSSNAPFWGLIFCGLGGMAAYQFFITWSDPEDDG